MEGTKSIDMIIIFPLLYLLFIFWVVFLSKNINSTKVDSKYIKEFVSIIIAIKNCLASLSDREEKILRLRFGISDDLLYDSRFELSEKLINEIS